MTEARSVLALAALLVAGFAAAAPAQLASDIHIVTAGNRYCPPMNSCSSLAGTSWFSSLFERQHFATSNWNPPGAPGTYYATPVADFVVITAPGDPTLAYLGSASASATEMPLGAAFNLLTIRGAPTCLFQHTSTVDNIVANVTFLDSPTLNGDPNAFILLLESGAFYNPTNVGVYYDAFRNQWGIFNEDHSAMDLNRWFTVYDDSCNIGLGTRYLFTCTFPEGNTCVLGFAGDPAVRILLTQLWDAGAPVYNPHPIGVYYDGIIWRVFNEDFAAMPAGVKFFGAVIRVRLNDDFETGDFTAWSAVTP